MEHNNKAYTYLYEAKDYREEMKRVNAPAGWWKPSDEKLSEDEYKKLVKEMNGDERAHEKRIQRALGYVLSLDYEYEDGEGEIYTLYDNTEMNQVIPTMTEETLAFNLYRMKRWSIRELHAELQLRGINKSRGWIYKLIKQWKETSMNGSQEKPLALTELEHAPVVRYFYTKQLYDNATDSEVKRRLELQLRIAERRLETWKRQRSLYDGGRLVNTIITKAASKNYVSAG